MTTGGDMENQRTVQGTESAMARPAVTDAATCGEATRAVLVTIYAAQPDEGLGEVAL